MVANSNGVRNTNNYIPSSYVTGVTVTGQEPRTYTEVFRNEDSELNFGEGI